MNRSDIVEFSDTVEIIEECYRLGWSDGLPVVPPVEYKVREMLELSGYTGEEEIITFEMRRRVLTAENAAANAVMAGCLPEYFPRPDHCPAHAGRGEKLRQHGGLVHQLAGHPDAR